MRRLLAVLAIAATLLAGAGCAADPAPPAATATPSDSTAPPDSSAAPVSPQGATPTVSPLAGNGREVCAAARDLATDKVTVIITEVGRSLEATAANNPKAAATARQAAEKAIRELVTGLRAQAARADDPRLKAQLTELAAQAGKMTGDPATIDDAKLDEVQERITALCGG
ncbi:MAG TPA: hypothetical protein VNV66_09490 [Pilimelia sp.]|nr:hypothetical protein [Pilimelia sp.]